jgi:hypothetical protein
MGSVDECKRNNGFQSNHVTSLPLQKGKAQIFDIGTYLRKRYSDFLDGVFMPEVNHLKIKRGFSLPSLRYSTHNLLA